MSITVIKVGGSLFDLPDLGARLTRLLSTLTGTRSILIPGGGPTADLVREWQPRFGLDEDVAHHLAISALDFNATLLARLITRGRVVQTVSEAVEAWQQGSIPILAPSQFLAIAEQRQPDEAPPHLWDVTSDSLAAWIAWQWPATELLLLKSTPLVPGTPVTQLSAAGLVDPFFPALAGRIRQVHWCNLRAEFPVVDPWLQGGAPLETSPVMTYTPRH